MKSKILPILDIQLLLVLLISMSCGSGESDPKPDPVVLEVSSVSVSDVSNYGNGRDLQISFSEIMSEELSEYRIIVVKESVSSTFDLDAAISLSANNYTRILPAAYQSEITLDDSALDSDGDPITNDVTYTVFVASIAKSNNDEVLSGINNSDAITLVEMLIKLEVSFVEVVDAGNLGNGRDLQISFDEISNSDLKEYRVIVVKERVAGSFTLETAMDLPETDYTQILPSNFESEFTLAETARDSEGDLVTEGESYIVFVATIIDEENLNYEGGIKSSEVIILSQTNLVRSIADGFSASGGIAVGDDGSIYIADFGSGSSNGTTILKFNSNGDLIETFANGLLGPTGGAFDSDGNLYWSSYSGGKVHKIDASGNVSDFVEIPGPVAIAVDNSDNLFIASCDGNDIKKVTTSGAVRTFATSSSFNCINGLTITENGVLYGCNSEDGKIFRITSDGTVSLFTTIPSGSSVNMTYLNGFLYVTGRDAHRIYIVNTTTGSVNALAGTGTRGNNDGAALRAEFSFPNGINFSNDGTKLYVNDVEPTSNSFNPNILRVIDLVQ